MEKYIPISEDASIEIYYSYDIKAYKLTNYVIAKEGFKEVPVEDFLEKYNISKGYIKAVSDKLLDSVLTDWKNFSGSPYSKDNMGTITVIKITKTGLTKNQSCLLYFTALINLDAISFGRVIAPPTTTLNAPAS